MFMASILFAEPRGGQIGARAGSTITGGGPHMGTDLAEADTF
jgi:hypothetical protein